MSLDDAFDPGDPGASARREYERRRLTDDQKRSARWGRAAPLVGFFGGKRQTTEAFRSGAVGEADVAALLAKRTEGTPVRLLHDRRAADKSRGNIDHIAVAPTGVYVIDAKAWKGDVRVRRPLFSKTELRVDGRDRTKSIDGLTRQVDTVRLALEAADHDVQIHGVLCFTKANLPLLGTTRIDGHLLVYRKALAKRLRADGPLGKDAIDAVTQCLANALPRA